MRNRTCRRRRINKFPSLLATTSTPLIRTLMAIRHRYKVMATTRRLRTPTPSRRTRTDTTAHMRTRTMITTAWRITMLRNTKGKSFSGTHIVTTPMGTNTIQTLPLTFIKIQVQIGVSHHQTGAYTRHHFPFRIHPNRQKLNLLAKLLNSQKT